MTATVNKATAIANIVKAAGGKVVQYKQLAEQLGVSIQSVTGSVASLKKDSSFFFVPGGVFALIEADEVAHTEQKQAREVRTNTKQAKANGVLVKFFSQQSFARKDLIAALMSEANLTKNGANTYIQNYKIRNGLIGKK